MPVIDLCDMGIALAQIGNVCLQRGSGCPRCRGTGYYGRIGIFELLPYSPALKRLTSSEVSHETIIAAARKEGLLTLRERAVNKLLSGMTTYHEVLRVT
jgi:general secretion pathway protein E